MPKTNTVNCYSPPAGYVVVTGENVRVRGWIYGQKMQILADELTKLSNPDSTCKCGEIPTIPIERARWGPEAEALREHEIETTGTVGSVKISSLGIEFKLLVRGR